MDQPLLRTPGSRDNSTILMVIRHSHRVETRKKRITSHENNPNDFDFYTLG